MKPQSVLRVLGNSDIQPRLVVEDQTTSDIIRSILGYHEKRATDYDKIAYMFSGGSVRDICRRLYDFLKENVDYNEESEDDQTVSAPATILRRGWADCKGYALFIGGVLDALRRRGEDIKFHFRFSCYQLFCTTPGHVFVVVDDPDTGKEIWVDPVLNTFDYHKPYWMAKDRYPTRSIGKIGCGCADESIGSATTTLIAATAPALAVIPVAGPFLAIGAKLVGIFGAVFGNNYSTSTGVRWLTQKYQYYVLGQTGVTSDNKVDEKYTEPAHQWFNAVFGVPIYDKFRLHTLEGTDPNTGQRLNPYPSETQRAQSYLQYPEVQGAVTMDQALAAAKIGTNFPIEIRSVAGAWKNLPVAPSVLEEINGQQQQQTAASNPLSNITSKISPVLLIGAGVLLFLLLTSKNK